MGRLLLFSRLDPPLLAAAQRLRVATGAVSRARTVVSDGDAQIGRTCPFCSEIEQKLLRVTLGLPKVRRVLPPCSIPR